MSKKGPMTYAEALDALSQLNMVAHTSHNGADWYECPMCSNTMNVRGNHFGSAPIWDFPHRAECPVLHARATLESTNRNQSEVSQ